MNTEGQENKSPSNPDVEIVENKLAIKTYPAPGSEEGFFFETEGDEADGIETSRYDNGGVTKRIVLSDGRVAKIRKLKGRDMVEAGKQAEGRVEKVSSATAAVATKINGEPLFLDDLLNMWANDYTTILRESASLNFM